VETGKQRLKRSDDVSNCSQNENDPFEIEWGGYDSPVICQRILVKTEPPPTEVDLCKPRPEPKLALSNSEPTGMVECLPGDDAFNPCQSLLGDDNHLRIAIWFVIILAFIGNFLVIVVFIGHSVIVRHARQKIFVVHFLYCNLAMADFLMCVYLLVIASKDADSRGHFFETDIEWRTSSACEFAGFCAIWSTVVSVYILTIITLERTHTIVEVLSHKKLTKKKAGIVLVIGWLLGFVIAALPLGDYFSSYNSVAICLPFDVTEPQSLAYVVLLLLCTGIAFVVIGFCYAIILYQVTCRRKTHRPAVDKMNRLAGEIKITIRILVVGR